MDFSPHQRSTPLDQTLKPIPSPQINVRCELLRIARKTILFFTPGFALGFCHSTFDIRNSAFELPPIPHSNFENLNSTFQSWVRFSFGNNKKSPQPAIPELFMQIQSWVRLVKFTFPRVLPHPKETGLRNGAPHGAPCRNTPRLSRTRLSPRHLQRIPFPSPARPQGDSTRPSHPVTPYKVRLGRPLNPGFPFRRSAGPAFCNLHFDTASCLAVITAIVKEHIYQPHDPKPGGGTNAVRPPSIFKAGAILHRPLPDAPHPHLPGEKIPADQLPAANQRRRSRAQDYGQQRSW